MLELPANPTIPLAAAAVALALAWAPAQAQTAQDLTGAWIVDAWVSADGAVVDEPEVSRKLHRYLASHSNIASSGSLNGVMPLATFITSNE